MTPTIQVRATRKSSARYKELLHAEWNRNTLDEILSLLWSLIAESANPASHAWQEVLAFGPGTKSGKEYNRELITRIQGLSVIFTEPSLPAMPSAFTTRRTRSTALAEKTWAYFILQAPAKLEGETGIFQDLQSLLFLCSTHYLLPQLRQQNLLSEHDCLINAMYVHTLLVWRDQPSHLYYLQGVLMDYLGDQIRKLHLLDISLKLTPVEDHSYLTKATAYWADLMELGRNKQALDFLLLLNRYTPVAYQNEIEEMIKETISGDK